MHYKGILSSDVLKCLLILSFPKPSNYGMKFHTCKIFSLCNFCLFKSRLLERFYAPSMSKYYLVYINANCWLYISDCIYHFLSSPEHHKVCILQGALGSSLAPGQLVLEVEEVAIVQSLLPAIRATDVIGDQRSQAH